jgi:MraZ protein
MCGKVEESVEDFQPTVFKGTYRHRIDPKGRLPVPAAFRRTLRGEGESRLVVTLLDQCLAAYPPREWVELEAQLRSLPAFSRPVKALTRLLTSRAADCHLDVQGRILLPGPLRESARLLQEAVVVGVLNRFEIWSPAAWSSFLEESERLLEDAALDVQWPTPPSPAGGAGRPTPPSERRRPQAKPNR